MDCMKLKPGTQDKIYERLLKFFRSSAVSNKALAQEWFKIICQKLPQDMILQYKGRAVLTIDGMNTPKEGRNMAGVQSLHQSSKSNSKRERIMGHFFQSITMLAGKRGREPMSIPLSSEIHLGTKDEGENKGKTILDKAASMVKSYLDILGQNNTKAYVLGDRYYNTKKMMSTIVASGSDFITRLKSNAVAYKLVEPDSQPKGRGRPKKYGERLTIKEWIYGKKDEDKKDKSAENGAKEKQVDDTEQADEGYEKVLSPLPREARKKIMIELKSTIMMNRQAPHPCKYVHVKHPHKGSSMVLVSTDTTLDAAEIYALYCRRHKIEGCFKKSVHTLLAYGYRFTMKREEKEQKIKIGDKAQDLSDKSEKYKKHYYLNLRASERFVLVHNIAHGLLIILGLLHPKTIKQTWTKRNFWLRTIAPDTNPSERMLKMCLDNPLMNFLKVSGLDPNLRKIILEENLFEDELCVPTSEIEKTEEYSGNLLE